jgi:hypothetical protein
VQEGPHALEGDEEEVKKTVWILEIMEEGGVGWEEVGEALDRAAAERALKRVLERTTGVRSSRVRKVER